MDNYSRLEHDEFCAWAPEGEKKTTLPSTYNGQSANSEILLCFLARALTQGTGGTNRSGVPGLSVSQTFRATQKYITDHFAS